MKCLDVLRATMPDGVSWTTPGGGPSVWIEFPRQVDLRQLQACLAERNVLIDLSEDWFLDTPHLHGTRIGYGLLPSHALQRGIEILAEELERLLGI
jgi:DNA-binding transcriptional MocR family regulator